MFFGALYSGMMLAGTATPRYSLVVLPRGRACLKVPCPTEVPCHTEHAIGREGFVAGTETLDQHQNRRGIPGSTPKPPSSPEVMKSLPQGPSTAFPFSV